MLQHLVVDHDVEIAIVEGNGRAVHPSYRNIQKISVDIRRVVATFVENVGAIRIQASPPEHLDDLACTATVVENSRRARDALFDDPVDTELVVVHADEFRKVTALTQSGAAGYRAFTGRMTTCLERARRANELQARLHGVTFIMGVGPESSCGRRIEMDMWQPEYAPRGFQSLHSDMRGPGAGKSSRRSFGSLSPGRGRPFTPGAPGAALE